MIENNERSGGDGELFGNSDRRPVSLASQQPRSVISPVTSRAGVTSKAGFAAGLSEGATRTVATEPSSARPVTVVTSLAVRSSIGMPAIPSAIVQSIVESGMAT